MNEAALVIGALLIACVLYGVFLLGRIDGKAANATEIKKSWNKTVSAECKYNSIKQELITINSVRHNLNCLVGDLRHDLDVSQTDPRKDRDEIRRLNKLLHEQNVTVLELSLEREALLKYKPDALAFNTLRGKWVTDNRHLIEYHQRKECFRCIGFPERRL